MGNIYVEWDSDLDLGIDAIDQQHKKIATYLNDLAEAIETKRTNTVIKNVVENLVKYTYTHLEHEEKLFLEMGQDQFKDHIAEHNKFRKQIDAMHEKISGTEDNTKPAKELYDILLKWLFGHIKVTDKKYVGLFKQFGY